MATGLKKKSCILESGQEVFVAKKNYSRKAFVKAGVISDNDNEMDNRAIAAVTTAIKKAKILAVVYKLSKCQIRKAAINGVLAAFRVIT